MSLMTILQIMENFHGLWRNFSIKRTPTFALLNTRKPSIVLIITRRSALEDMGSANTSGQVGAVTVIRKPMTQHSSWKTKKA